MEGNSVNWKFVCYFFQQIKHLEDQKFDRNCVKNQISNSKIRNYNASNQNVEQANFAKLIAIELTEEEKQSKQMKKIKCPITANSKIDAKTPSIEKLCVWSETKKQSTCSSFLCFQVSESGFWTSILLFS